MNTYEIIRGDCFNIGVQLDESYNLANMEDLTLNIGQYTPFNKQEGTLEATDDERIFLARLSSAYTDKITNYAEITATVDDVELGIRSKTFGTLKATRTASKSATEDKATDTIDLLLTLAIVSGELEVSQTWITVMRGFSAYEIAVQNGFEGTESEWLDTFEVPKDEALAAQGAAELAASNAEASAVSTAADKIAVESARGEVLPARDVVLANIENYPFHATANFGDKAWIKTAILSADLGLLSSYDNTKYYSFATISKTADRLSLTLYASPNLGGGDWIGTSTVFTTTEVSADKPILLRHINGSMVIIPANIPTGEYSSLSYTSYGLDSKVFKENYSVRDRVENNNLQIVLLSFVSGYYVNSAGNLLAGSYSTSKHFDIKQGDVFRVSGLSNNGVNVLSFYKHSGEYISGLAGNGQTFSNYKMVAPANVGYYIVCSNNSNLATFYLQKERAKIAREVTTTLELTKVEIGFNPVFAYISPSGAITTNSSWRMTEKLKLKRGGNYWYSLRASYGSYSMLAFFDSRGGFISNVASPPSVNTLYSMVKIEIPENASYVVFTVNTTYLSTFLLYSDYQTLTNSVAVYKEQELYNLLVPRFFNAVIGKNNDIWLSGVSVEPRAFQEGRVFPKIDASYGVVRRANMLRYAPTAATANFSGTIRTLDTNLALTVEQPITFRTISNNVGNGTDEVNIMLVGDSLTDNSSLPSELYSMLNADADYAFNQLGTRGAAGRWHEGRGSWTWNNYLNTEDYASKNNAFLYSGVLDFTQYCTDNAYDGIDIVLINLGTNDVGQGETIRTEAFLDAIIANAKLFIDALLADYPAVKIGIALPAFGCDSFAGSNASAEVFRSNIGRLGLKYLKTFDNGAYSANITCFSLASSIDSYNSYPYVDEATSSRISANIRVFGNTVHPEAVGYYQWADAYYRQVRAFLSGVI